MHLFSCNFIHAEGEGTDRQTDRQTQSTLVISPLTSSLCPFRFPPTPFFLSFYVAVFNEGCLQEHGHN